MAIGSIYERANKNAYDMITAAKAAMGGDEVANQITTKIFPTILKKVGATIMRSDPVARNYDRFKIPVSEFGALTEYLASSMIRPDDPTPIVTGTLVDDFVINNPRLYGRYVDQVVRANYPLTVNTDYWEEAIDAGDTGRLASMIALATQALYDGITHDHDSMIPALFGALYEMVPEASIRTIPAYTGTGVEDYAKAIMSTLNKAIRDLTQWRTPQYNMIGADMSDSKNDLVLVAFDNPASASADPTILDIISAQLNIGPLARATALGNSLGVTVYEMPTAGVVESSVARAYGIPTFPGMQTADTMAGTLTVPHPNVKFALAGRAAVNVGLKKLKADTGRSIRGHFDQTWVEPAIELAFGAGQVIFFKDGNDPAPTAKATTTTAK